MANTIPTTPITLICHSSSSIVIFLLIIALIPTFQVLVGWHHFHSCPISPSIPQYLIVAGLVGLTVILLLLTAQCLTRWTCASSTASSSTSRHVVDERQPVRSKTMFVSCGVCSIMCINLSLVIFLFGWFVTGWIWMIEVWNRVQYDAKMTVDYCHPMVYQCTIVSLLLTTMMQLFLLCWICCKVCVNVKQRSKKETVIDDGE